jgi:hypothetical protein
MKVGRVCGCAEKEEGHSGQGSRNTLKIERQALDCDGEALAVNSMMQNQ